MYELTINAIIGTGVDSVRLFDKTLKTVPWYTLRWWCYTEPHFRYDGPVRVVGTPTVVYMRVDGKLTKYTRDEFAAISGKIGRENDGRASVVGWR